MNSTEPATEVTTEQYAGDSTTAPAEPQRQHRLAARLSTILWGVILLAFAVTVGAMHNREVIVDPVSWMTGALIVGGLALVAIGIAAAARRN